MTFEHRSVLFEETMEGLAIRPWRQGERMGLTVFTSTGRWEAAAMPPACWRAWERAAA